MSPRDRFWRSKANLEVAKRNSPRDWLEDWGAASLLPVRPLQLFTNILVGVCRCIISIFFVWKIENRSRGSDLAIIFLGTAFRWSNGPIDFRSSFPSTRAGFCPAIIFLRAHPQTVIVLRRKCVRRTRPKEQH